MSLLKNLDWRLLGGALILTFLGLLALSITPAGGVDNLLWRQVAFSFAGLALAIGISQLNFEVLRLNSFALLGAYGLILILLLLVLFFGTPIRGAKSWLAVGSFIFQPSEIAKIVGILILAKYFSHRHSELYRTWHIIVSAVYTGLLMVLVAVQPDFGTAALIGLTWVGMVILAGLPGRRLALVFLAVAVALVSLWFFVLAPYQQDRVLSFINPEFDPLGAGYNQNQALIAIGSGGILGQGFEHAYQTKLGFLPEAHSDFIFAVLGEMFGGLGLLILIIIFIYLTARLMGFAFFDQRQCLVPPSNFGRLYAAGLAVLIWAEAGINIGMNIGLLPVTGVPLPFVSAGGSHTLAFWLGLGIYQSFWRRTK